MQGDRLFATNYPIDLQQDSLLKTETVGLSELRLKTSRHGSFIFTKPKSGFAAMLRRSQRPAIFGCMIS
ncbi:MAG: hypothetical protein ACJATW_000119 [Glaciecola sp.]